MVSDKKKENHHRNVLRTKACPGASHLGVKPRSVDRPFRRKVVARFCRVTVQVLSRFFEFKTIPQTDFGPSVLLVAQKLTANVPMVEFIARKWIRIGRAAKTWARRSRRVHVPGLVRVKHVFNCQHRKTGYNYRFERA